MFAACLLSFSSAAAPGDQLVQTDVEVLPLDASWDWLIIQGPSGVQLDPVGQDPDFLQTWTTPAYNGPAFRSDIAPLSYGGIDHFDSSTDPRLHGTVMVNPPPIAGSRNTVYFRKMIHLPGALSNATLEFLVDDGLILYVDGVRWISHNMAPNSSSAFTQMAELFGTEWATTTVASDSQGLALPSLAAGPHLICASVHNQMGGSSDIGFMLRITGDLTMPVVVPPLPELTSAPAPPSTDGSPRIFLSAKNLDPAASYFPQSSSDMIHWFPLGSFPPMPARTAFTLDVSAAAERRYYRMVYQRP